MPLLTIQAGLVKHRGRVITELILDRALGDEPRALSIGRGTENDLVLESDLTVLEYRFHVRDGGDQLLWREDRHAGHEHERGMRGPEHVHRIQGGREVRLPADPVDLAGIREALIQANIDHAS